MNAELAALRVLAQAIADRLSDENTRSMEAGHGRPDADPADLTALIARQVAFTDAMAVVAALHKHV